ncbi:MAG: LacI family transcriptional regulator [Chloroflexi bacterium]|nr:LacI family transcriptional regulator [Chloroflexota bacterium]
MSPTIYDVAERAGVGIATVSRVLNNSSRVRAETRARVLAAMEELGYEPSPLAQRRPQRRPLALAVIVPFFTRPSFVERLRGIEAAVAEREYDLVVYNVETPEMRDASFRKALRRNRVDGLIIMSLSPDDEDVRNFQKQGVPVVLVDARHPALNQVVVNDVAGGELATKHLLELGHRHIAFLGDIQDNPFHFVSSRYRYQGYCRALKAAGVVQRPEYHKQGEHSHYQAQVFTHELLDMAEPPTAIFAASDTQAMGCLEAVRKRGLRPPDDISIVGYDDIEVAEYVGLTTIHQPLYEAGLRSVELLLDVIERPDRSPVSMQLPVHLVERQTSGPPKQIASLSA